MGWLYWDPSRDIFTIPFINRPIGWYGLLFVTGLIISFWIVLYLFKTLLKERGLVKNESEVAPTALALTDRLTWFVVLGIVIGARLGHVFFYDWPYYQRHPLDILKVWEGGLASHGGVLGIMLAILLYCKSIKAKYPSLTFWTITDLVAVPSALAGAFIRLGNFFNQEILGTPSNAPWAIIFGHPADYSEAIPRHPVQLYEAFAYLVIFLTIFSIWKWTSARRYPGFITGIFFIILFSARIILEFFKTSQSHMMSESVFQTGQLLSIPFIIIGAILVYVSKNRKEIPNHHS
jgi:prolipoprotein diacylglyceryl transferase